MHLGDNKYDLFNGAREVSAAAANDSSNDPNAGGSLEASIQSIQVAAQRICDEFSDVTLHEVEAEIFRRVSNGVSTTEAESKIRSILNETEGFSEGSMEDLSPIPIPVLPDVPKLDMSIFPEALRSYVVNCAARRSSPVEYSAVATLVALGAVIGTKVRVQPKANDTGYCLFANLYAMIIGPSGVKKTPSIEDGLRFILDIEEDARKRFKDREPEISATATCRKLEIEALERQIKASYGGGRTRTNTDSIVDREVLTQRLAALKAVPPETAERLVIQDSTIEKIGILLNENPNGLLAVHDEISPLLDDFGNKEKQRDRGFYLRAANGTGTEIIDRVTRDGLYVSNLCLSVIGGIQPARIASLAAATVNRGGDDGLLPRFGVTVWPDPPDYEYVDTPPQGERLAEEVFQRLYKLNPADYRIKRRTEDLDGHYFMTFSADAQAFYTEWLIEHERQTRRRFGTNGTDIPAAHYSKYSGLMPKLALIFQLVDLVSNVDNNPDISEKNARLAASWIEFFAAHAVRLYAGTEKPEFRRARTILGHLQSGKLSPIFTARDLYRKHWRDLSDAKEVMPALDVLVEYQWIRAVRTESGTKPVVKYVFNDTS